MNFRFVKIEEFFDETENKHKKWIRNSPNSNNNKNMYAYPVPLNVQQINLLQMTQKCTHQIMTKST